LGVWVLGFGFWGLAPTPHPQIPNPQSPIPNGELLIKKNINNNFL